jgi:endogenous inhibitor of DNA gyrase (YacG/DUF329 family)
MEVSCPGCGKKKKYEGNLFRPFCSERCKLIDLGAWADGKRAIPSDHDPETDLDRTSEKKNQDHNESEDS